MKLSAKFRSSLFLIWLLTALVGCQKNNQTILSSDPVAIEENFQPEVKILTWKDGKKAAYTLAFDDARESHYQLAWPEMQKRGILGTFNINTPGDLNWVPWKYLAAFGNEIASHTVSHLDLTELSGTQLDFELGESAKRIKTKIHQNPFSLAQPFGRSNPFVEDHVRRFYFCARCDFDINSNNLTGNEFYHLKAIGVYPSITQQFLRKKLEQTIQENGYLIVTFHSLYNLRAATINNTYMPIDFFRTHLDDVIQFSDDLWIAPQADIIKYMRLRQNAKVACSRSDSKLSFKLQSDLNPTIFDIPLTVEISLPHNWRSRKIVTFTKSILPFTVQANADTVFYLNIRNNQEINLKAF